MLGHHPRRTVRLMISMSLIATSLGVVAAPAEAGAPAPCQAWHLGNVRPRATLQEVLTAPDAVTVRFTGTCIGPFAINRSVTIEGVETAATGRAVLKGNGTNRVITVASGQTVSLTNLTVRDGFTNAPTYPASSGGGIRNNGNLTLTDVIVKRNRAVRGAGISTAGKLTILRGRIAYNVASNSGGGIDVDGSNRAATLTITNVRIDHNRAYSGGGINAYGATELITGGSITDNEAALGGGISTVNVVRGRNDIRNKLTLTNVWMASNTAEAFGAAINAEGVIVLGGDTLIEDHDMTDAPFGGMVEVFAYDWDYPTEFTMKETALITENVASAEGAAVVVWQDCGPTPPVTSGLALRVKGNTPTNIWTRTGTTGC